VHSSPEYLAHCSRSSTIACNAYNNRAEHSVLTRRHSWSYYSGEALNFVRKIIPIYMQFYAPASAA